VALAAVLFAASTLVAQPTVLAAQDWTVVGGDQAYTMSSSMHALD
jgi:hypothetical protein